MSTDRTREADPLAPARTQPRSPARRLHIALALAGLVAWTVYAHLPLLACLDRCYVDTEALHPGVGNLELLDTRLNVWILAAMQRNLLQRPLELFEANVFHPAPDVLAGSETLLGLAAIGLPLQLATSDAIPIHQLLLFATALAGALASFVLARGVTQSAWIGFVAGWIALFMPWRLMELSHLQLLAASAFPLAWWAAFRILFGETGRREGWVLAGVLSIVLLTSFYLAYLISVSFVALGVVIAAVERPRMRAWTRLARAAAAPYALLLLLSLPYLTRQAQGELATTLNPQAATQLSDVLRVWRMLAPPWEFVWQLTTAVPLRYSVPLSVALLAAFGWLAAIWPGRARAEADRRRRAIALALAAIAVTGFVFMLGYRLQLGDASVPLPGAFAAAWVPGFLNLRAVHRWGILVATTVPILAALGLRAAERSFGGRSVAGAPLAMVVRGLLALLLLSNVPWRQIPARPAWDDPEGPRPVYAALATLPAGALLEVPWSPRRPALGVHDEAESLVVSTRSWRPLLNGYTGYLPPAYHFLRRVAARLPEREAVDRLRRAAGLRWIVVHLDRLSPEERAVWNRKAAAGGLRVVQGDGRDRIYEVPARSDTGEWIEAMRSSNPRSQTFEGVSRQALELGAPAGVLRARLLDPLAYLGNAAIPARLELEIENQSPLAWPGFDLQRDGLVEVRAVFANADGHIEKSARVPIDADVPPGATTHTLGMLESPTRSGHYRICLELVQRFPDGDRVLPVPPVELAADVWGTDLEPEIGRFLLLQPTKATWACGDAALTSLDPSAHGW